ncbi:hypothetical protein EDB85DRAFT_1888983 [Lactarius pseudohatsudake]|nr:hypothetical protein EDB85DRAFT_1888983 [Lactarius pseudohatsudake]
MTSFEALKVDSHTGFGVFAYNFTTKFADIKGEFPQDAEEASLLPNPTPSKFWWGMDGITISSRPDPGELLLEHDSNPWRPGDACGQNLGVPVTVERCVVRCVGKNGRGNATDRPMHVSCGGGYINPQTENFPFQSTTPGHDIYGRLVRGIEKAIRFMGGCCQRELGDELHSEGTTRDGGWVVGTSHLNLAFRPLGLTREVTNSKPLNETEIRNK